MNSPVTCPFHFGANVTCPFFRVIFDSLALKGKLFSLFTINLPKTKVVRCERLSFLASKHSV